MLKRIISFDNDRNQMLIIQNSRELQTLIYLKRGRGNTVWSKKKEKTFNGKKIISKEAIMFEHFNNTEFKDIHGISM